MGFTETYADALLRGDESRLTEFSAQLIVPEANNFVERPWGGLLMRDFKGLCALPAQIEQSGFGLGEAFEIAAYDRDAEVREHPSFVRCADGSRLPLPKLLALQGEAILGAKFVRHYGACFPLLPKTLDIKELLSVQGHPAGNVEAYIIIKAEPGATIRLGFGHDVDASELKPRLANGLELQRRLLELLGPGRDERRLQQVLSAWFADCGAGSEALKGALASAEAPWPELARVLEALKRLYWDVLERLNAIPVSAGQVIYNATPARIVAAGRRPVAAEVHALGNPERREILALEIRRPGPTFRAWDNVRFPMREVDADAALVALNLARTEPAEFIVTPVPVAGRPGTTCSVDCDFFRIEHLEPTPELKVEVPSQMPHCLHVLAGAVVVHGHDGRQLGCLARGQSALVPVGVGAYGVSAARGAAHIVKVSLPEPEQT